MLELSPDEPGISLTNETTTNETFTDEILSSDYPVLVLTINVSEADSATIASTDGVSYYCLASNDLGIARSQPVTLQYPSK